MLIECKRCGQVVETTRVGDRVHIEYPGPIQMHCPIFKERAEKGEILDIMDLDCPHMNEAISAA